MICLLEKRKKKKKMKKKRYIYIYMYIYRERETIRLENMDGQRKKERKITSREKEEIKY